MEVQEALEPGRLVTVLLPWDAVGPGPSPELTG